MSDILDKIKSFEQSEEIQKAVDALMDDFTDFYKQVLDKEVDAAFLLMLCEAITRDITIREVIEKYCVERTDPIKKPIEYENGRIKNIAEACQNEVQFNICKREKPIELSDFRYNEIATEMVTYLQEKIGKDLVYEEN